MIKIPLALPLKPVAIAGAALCLLLSASVGINLWQLHRAGVAEGEHVGALQAAELRGTAEAQAGVIQRTAQVAEMAADDRDKLLKQLEAIAQASRERVIVYQDRVRTLPPLPAQCGPGQGRIDAINELAGGRP